MHFQAIKQISQILKFRKTHWLCWRNRFRMKVIDTVHSMIMVSFSFFTTFDKSQIISIDALKNQNSLLLLLSENDVFFNQPDTNIASLYHLLLKYGWKTRYHHWQHAFCSSQGSGPSWSSTCFPIFRQLLHASALCLRVMARNFHSLLQPKKGKSLSHCVLAHYFLFIIVFIVHSCPIVIAYYCLSITIYSPL